jgi:iron complex outermembrane receptor protein
MKNLRLLLFMIPMLLCTLLVNAQKTSVKGKVIDKETGAPLSGVTIMFEKNKKAVTTNNDGTFSFTINTPDKNVTFTYVGYLAQKMTLGEETNYVIPMVQDNSLQSEVVVIGYGTQKNLV